MNLALKIPFTAQDKDEYVRLTDLYLAHIGSTSTDYKVRSGSTHAFMHAHVQIASGPSLTRPYTSLRTSRTLDRSWSTTRQSMRATCLSTSASAVSTAITMAMRCAGRSLPRYAVNVCCVPLTRPNSTTSLMRSKLSLFPLQRVSGHVCSCKFA